MRGRRQHGRQPLAVREGHGVVVARVREQHARQAARRGDEVEVLEERPQRGGVEARRVLAALRAAGRASGSRSSSSRPASSDAPSAGQSSTSERNSSGRARAASSSMQPPMLAPRAASHGAPDSASSRSPAATASRQPSGPMTPPLSPWPRKSKVSAARPARRRLLAHQLVVLLAAAGAVAHEQRAARRGRPAGRAGRPARRRPRRSRAARAAVRRGWHGRVAGRGVACTAIAPSVSERRTAVMYYRSHPVDGGPMHEVNVGHKTLADYRSIVPRDLMAEIDELAERLRAGRSCTSTPPPSAAAWPRSSTRWCRWSPTSGSRRTGRSSRRRPSSSTSPRASTTACRGTPSTSRRRRVPSTRTSAAPTPPSSRGPTTSSSSTTRSRWPCATSSSRQPGPLHVVDLALPHRHVHARTRACTTTCCRPSTATTRPSTPCATTCPQGLTVPVREIAPTIDPLAPKNMKLSRRGRHLHRAPVRHRRGAAAAAAGLALRPVEGPARRRRRLPRRQGASTRTCSSRSSAPWPATTRRAGTTSSSVIDYVGGDPDVFILSNLDNVGSVEINAFQSHADVDHAEVHARGVRAHRDRGAVEGPADDRRRRRRHPAADRGRRHRVPRRAPPPSAPSAACRSWTTRRSTARWRCSARRRCAASSSRRACCATTCGSSPTCMEGKIGEP